MLSLRSPARNDLASCLQSKVRFLQTQKAPLTEIVDATVKTEVISLQLLQLEVNGRLHENICAMYKMTPFVFKL